MVFVTVHRNEVIVFPVSWSSMFRVYASMGRVAMVKANYYMPSAKDKQAIAEAAKRIG
jgi:hypothetical protein